MDVSHTRSEIKCRNYQQSHYNNEWSQLTLACTSKTTLCSIHCLKSHVQKRPNNILQIHQLPEQSIWDIEVLHLKGYHFILEVLSIVSIGYYIRHTKFLRKWKSASIKKKTKGAWDELDDPNISALGVWLPLSFHCLSSITQKPQGINRDNGIIIISTKFSKACEQIKS